MTARNMHVLLIYHKNLITLMSRWHKFEEKMPQDLIRNRIRWTRILGVICFTLAFAAASMKFGSDYQILLNVVMRMLFLLFFVGWVISSAYENSCEPVSDFNELSASLWFAIRCSEYELLQKEFISLKQIAEADLSNNANSLKSIEREKGVTSPEANMIRERYRKTKEIYLKFQLVDPDDNKYFNPPTDPEFTRVAKQVADGVGTVTAELKRAEQGV